MKKRGAGHEEFTDIRDGVRALCAKFPGEYWRALDRERAYPTEFVAALTKAGYLAALIPEEYGGSGLNLAAAAAITTPPSAIQSRWSLLPLRRRPMPRLAARALAARRPASTRGR